MMADSTDRARALAGQVAVVTGGSRGIGLGIAASLAGAGAAVALIARSERDLDAAVASLSSRGAVARGWRGDVTDAGFMTRAIGEIERTLGPIDLLINNAGDTGPFGPLADVPHDQWWRCVEVNLKGTALGMQLVLPRMCARGGGRIINVVSGAGIMAFSYFSAYVAAKTAVTRLSQSAAVEAGPYGVRVFAMEPGTVATDMADRAINTVEGKRWIPWFGRMFTEGLNSTTERVGARALEIALGKADQLSGLFVPIFTDLAEMQREAPRIRAERLYLLGASALPPAAQHPKAAAIGEIRAVGGSASAAVLQLRRTLPCSPAEAFALWTSAERAAVWFLPLENAEWLAAPIIDARPGGQLRFDVRSKGERFELWGTFREVTLPSRLVLDWSWRTESAELGNGEHTTLTVTFAASDGGAEVRILHEGLPTVGARDRHIRGWVRSLDGMERILRGAH